MDNLGDVILTGPAVRALAASGREVVYLCSPRGRPAAMRLPGVSRVLTSRAEWIEADPRPVTRPAIDQLVHALAAVEADEAVIFTSFHQSALPLALVMRMSGVARIAAISVDYPGSLLDVRHSVDDDVHEVERALSLVEAAGSRLPDQDDRHLRLDIEDAPGILEQLPDRYVVVHAGASVPARAWSPHHHAGLVEQLAGTGRHVVLTGGPDEVGLTAEIKARAGRAGPVTDLAGRTDFPALAAVLGRASAVVCGNTGPAHVAAAMGTPVVSIYAPTVPAVRWRPWMVPHVLLGRQDIACAGCRARVCPVSGHPCLSEVSPVAVAAAAERLASDTEAVAS